MNIEIERWVSEYTEPLLKYAFKRLSVLDTAKDLVQETFLSVLKTQHEFKGESKPLTWLTGILNNKISEYYRYHYKSIESIAELERSLDSEFFNSREGWHEKKSPQKWGILQTELLDTAGFSEVLEMCLENLPALWNSVMRYKFLKQDTDSDISKVSESNMWQIARRAKLKLRKCIEGNWFGTVGL